MSVESLSSTLRSGGVIPMDGAMGTELGRLDNDGIQLGLVSWSAAPLETSEGQLAIANIHSASIAAGARIIITNTFRAGRLGEGAAAATLTACRLATSARLHSGEKDIVIAGSVGPVGDCYIPEETPDDDTLKKSHGIRAAQLKRGGVDFELIETTPTGHEALIAARSAAEAGLPFAVSYYVQHHNGWRLQSGEPVDEAVEALYAEKLTPLFLGGNCISPETATQLVSYLAGLSIRPPISVYAQGYDESSPLQDEGVTDQYEHYLLEVDKWLQAGAQVVGGCCGVPPSWIKTIAERINYPSTTNPQDSISG